VSVAKTIRDSKFDDDMKDGQYMEAWAFISVVFGWKEYFYRSITDFQETAGVVEMLSDLDMQWRVPIDRRVLGTIFSMLVY